MSNEVAHNFKPGQTLYSCRFQLNGDVFLTSGASDEVWGTGGRDADDYDVAVPEKGSSGHYVGDFDPSGNIAEGFYRITVYHQTGASPVDADVAISQGVGRWSGTEFIPCAIEQDVIDAHAITDALLAALAADAQRVKNVYGPDEMTSEGVNPESLT